MSKQSKTVKKIIGQGGLKPSYLAEKSGISYASFLNFINGKQNLGHESLERIAEVLEYEIIWTPKNK